MILPFRPGPCKGADSGMALVAVLALLSVLLVAALELARQTGTSALATANGADRILAREQAMAGIHLGMAMLAEDGAKTKIDSVQEDWARPDKLALAVKAMGYDRDGLELTIIDELGKLPVNSLIKTYPGNEANPDTFNVWERFFDTFTEEPLTLLNPLKDWLDREDDLITGLSGAESDYYLSLDPPYTCANGPFTHISELFLVKGITPALFKPKSDDPDNDEADAKEIIPGEIITVHGLDEMGKKSGTFSFSPRVNINTAPEAVIRALLDPIQADLAKDLMAFREEMGENKEGYINGLDKGWPAQVLGESKDTNSRFNRLIRYDSHLFRIKARAVKGHSKISICALVHRSQDKLSGKWSCHILQVIEEI